MRSRGEVFETPADAPTYELPEAFWKKAARPAGQGRTASVHLRVDRYVLDWFRSQGRGHLTRMNAVLRAFYEAHREEGGASKGAPAAKPKRGRSALPKQT